MAKVACDLAGDANASRICFFAGLLGFNAPHGMKPMTVEGIRKRHSTGWAYCEPGQRLYRRPQGSTPKDFRRLAEATVTQLAERWQLAPLLLGVSFPPRPEMKQVGLLFWGEMGGKCAGFSATGDRLFAQACFAMIFCFIDGMVVQTWGLAQRPCGR